MTPKHLSRWAGIIFFPVVMAICVALEVPVGLASRPVSAQTSEAR